MRPDVIQRTKTYFDWALTQENHQSRDEVLISGKYVESLGRLAVNGSVQLFVGVYTSAGIPIHEEYRDSVPGVTVVEAIASGLKRGREIGRVGFDDLDQRINSFVQYDDFIEGCSGRVKLATKSSCLHISMARKILGVDPLMAVFRSVCAEEEAAAALIFSLKRLRYKGADKIQFRSHQDKQAIIIFIQAIKSWYTSFHAENITGLDNLRLFPCKAGKRKAFGVFMPIKGTSKSVFIEPPLSLKTKNGLRWEDIIFDGVKAIATQGGFGNFPEMVKDRANFRNQILYASDQSLPKYDGDVFLYVFNQAGMVATLIRALGLIDPWAPPKYEYSDLVCACIEGTNWGQTIIHNIRKSWQLPSAAGITGIGRD
ncbi:hypothetical protein [Pseudomonas sp. 37 R 15]|uniref:hypothetical protein n=1 Tax=Pseudomonas sp. 37 R 15 TaxID=1844104 RepID=UPI000812B2DC|nr:hypothetical protein [Pseudomonas sp. 37 R 15]CRM70361.1 hypothetical protein [Pseudomonas sp. 37 R 15]